MNKRESRQVALHMIFEMEFKSKNEQAEIFEMRMNKVIFKSISDEMDFYAKDINKSHGEYIKKCVDGVRENIEEIDEIIAKYSKDWNIKRMSKVSLAILRLSVFEIKYLEEIPNGASINEAVEISKIYDNEEAGAFINGILGSFVREIDG